MAAAILAKHSGKRVLVLEFHYTPGGYTHTFRRGDYEWDVGRIRGQSWQSAPPRPLW